MRCPDCNKFVSYDDSNDPDIQDISYADGHVSAQIRVVLPCGDCGTELKSADFDLDLAVALPEDAEDHKCHYEAIIGCPSHVAGTACPVCKWNGTPNPPAKPYRMVRHNPPMEYAQLGEGVKPFVCIGEIDHSIYEESDRQQFEERWAKVERANSGIPKMIIGRDAYDEDPDFDVEATASLTSRSDCGKNKRTGKTNKFNPRYATTYYGYELTGTIRCGCGGVMVEFEASDDMAASSFDEQV